MFGVVSGFPDPESGQHIRLALSDGWWLRGQANYDMAVARESMGEALARIAKCALLPA